MNGFEDREKGFEAKYRVDQEAEFKITAHRNKLLGKWAAEQMGMTGAAAEDYAKATVMADFEKPGDSDVLEKVLADFRESNLDLGADDIRRKMEELMAVARTEAKT